MPSINRVRMVNVTFNDANFFYDDLILPFKGKSGTIDLVNGGGKSVFLMMLLQVVLPNSSLDSEKPVKNIFSGGKNRTSHVLAEWRLDEGSSYKYMVTGFCARNRRDGKDDNPGPAIEEDENISSRDIDYFNYCYFYNEKNPDDIKSIKLSFNKEVMSYDNLKNYIKSLKKSYEPFLFFKKREYLDFLKTYNLIDTEWKIIKEINGKENNIKEYFRKNKTSRKVIENLLIKIIEDMQTRRVNENLGDRGSEEDLAEALIKIKENLKDCMEKQKYLYEYEAIRDLYKKIAYNTEKLRLDFIKINEQQKESVMIRNKLESIISSLEEEKRKMEEKMEENSLELKEGELKREILDIQKIQIEKSGLEKKLSDLNQEIFSCEKEKENIDKSLNISLGQNRYLEYKENSQILKICQDKLENFEKDSNELIEGYKDAGFNYRRELEKLIEKVKENIKINKEKIDKEEENKKIYNKEISGFSEKQGTLKSELKHLDKSKREIEEKESELKTFLQGYGEMEYLLYPEKSKEKVDFKQEEIRNSINKTKATIDNLNSDNIEKDKEISKLQGEIKIVTEKLKEPINFLEEYKSNNNEINILHKIYEEDGSDEFLLHKLEENINSLKNEEVDLKIKLKTVNNQIEFIKENDYYVPNEKIAQYLKKLEGKNYNPSSGIEYLQSQKEENKRALLEKYPLLPYSILLSGNKFTGLKEKESLLHQKINDHPFPVINMDAIRNETSLDNDNIFFFCGDTEIFLNKNKIEEIKSNLENEKSKIEDKLNSLRENLKEAESQKKKLEYFLNRFTGEVIQEKIEEKNRLNDDINRINKNIKEIQYSISKNKENLDSFHIEVNKFKDKSNELSEINKALTELIHIKPLYKKIKVEINEKTKDLGLCEDRLEKSRNYLLTAEESIRYVKDVILNDLNLKAYDYGKELEPVNNFSSGKELNLSYEEIKIKYKALCDSNKKYVEEKRVIVERITAYESLIRSIQKQIESYGLNIDFFRDKEASGEILTNFTDEYINSLKKDQQTIEIKLKDLKDKETTLKIQIANLSGQITSKKESLQRRYEREYIPVEGLFSQEDIEKEKGDVEFFIKLRKDDKKKLTNVMKNIEIQLKEKIEEKEKFNFFITGENIEVFILDETEKLIKYELFNDSYKDLKRDFESNRRNWENFKEEVLGNKEKFEYVNNFLKDLKKLTIPENLMDAEEKLKQIDGYNSTIDQSINRFLGDIERLKGYQEKFNTRCIHKAEWLLEKLEKFPKHSFIKINGSGKRMIELTFVKFSEDRKKEKMDRHIKSIVEEIEKEQSIDKNKIAQKLSSKELLSQITDMDRASLGLYKVESVPESSRYKKWEEADLSDGQANALYFIFAVCLLSYIKSLSFQNNYSGSKGVIIADNPFGATSANYLWEPMFKILEENSIQLIATGHDITEHLTSQFNYNHILEQKILADGRVKVVMCFKTKSDPSKLRFDEIKEAEQIEFL